MTVPPSELPRLVTDRHTIDKYAKQVASALDYAHRQKE
jgi:hypothetical protein